MYADRAALCVLSACASACCHCNWRHGPFIHHHTTHQVAQRIEARAAARQAKDFAAADAVRKELAAKGVMLMDSPQGTNWRPGLPEGVGGEPSEE